MRYCKYCGIDKPYDQNAKKDSKASGFYGARCWVCYCQKHASLQPKRTLTAENKAYYIRKWYARQEKLDSRAPCSWDDATKNRAIRTQAQHLTQTTGVLYHTDHIVPRFGEVVSGLECHCNLQPMLGSTNGSKSNKWDVDADSVWMHEYHLKMFEANFSHR